MIKQLRNELKNKVIQLNKKNDSLYILLTIVLTSLFYYNNLQFSFYLATLLSGKVFRNDVLGNFQLYESDYYFCPLALGYLLSSPGLILFYTHFVATAKKVLEYFLTNLFLFKLILVI